MAVTAGRSSLTAQTIASSYETCFQANAPNGSGSNGSPVRLFTLHAAGETITVKYTRFGGQVGEMIVPADKDRQVGHFPAGITKLEAKSASGTGTLVWEDTL